MTSKRKEVVNKEIAEGTFDAQAIDHAIKILHKARVAAAPLPQEVWKVMKEASDYLDAELKYYLKLGAEQK